MKKLIFLLIVFALLAGAQSCYFHFDDQICMPGFGTIVSEELGVRINSVGNVYYMGRPRLTIHDSGIGDIIHIN